MGSSLYGDAQVCVRELIQNGIDACLLRQAMESTWGNQYIPEIKVVFGQVDGEPTLQVSDNGIGMDQDIIDKYFSRIGCSFYKSADFYALQAKHKTHFQPISRFGIGILSCFMVSDSLQVDTRRLYDTHSSSNPIQLRIEGLESVFWMLDGSRGQPGTTMDLTLRTDNPWAAMTDIERIATVVKAVPHPPFPITICSGDETTIHDGRPFLTARPPQEWNKSAHVRQLDIDITDTQLDLAGTASVVVLDDGGQPIGEKELFAREVSVEGFAPLHLTTTLRVGTNAITRHSCTLEVKESEIDTSYYDYKQVESECALAVHGISVPVNVVEEAWRNPRMKTRLSFPFPVWLRIDVIDQRDLDLNTARSEIIYNEKWLDFAEAVSFAICRGVRYAVDGEYWEELCRIWRSKDGVADYFVRGLARAME
jgi:hypothetical protein